MYINIFIPLEFYSLKDVSYYSVPHRYKRTPYLAIQQIFIERLLFASQNRLENKIDMVPPS